MNEQRRPDLPPPSVMRALEDSKAEIEAGGPFEDFDAMIADLRRYVDRRSEELRNGKKAPASKE